MSASYPFGSQDLLTQKATRGSSRRYGHALRIQLMRGGKSGEIDSWEAGRRKEEKGGSFPPRECGTVGLSGVGLHQLFSPDFPIKQMYLGRTGSDAHPIFFLWYIVAINTSYLVWHNRSSSSANDLPP